MTARTVKPFKFQALKILKYSDYSEIANLDLAGDVTFNMTPTVVNQMAGPSNFPVEAEVGDIQTEATIAVQQYGSEIQETLLGASTTAKSISQTAGVIDSAVNRVGTLFSSTGSAITAVTATTDTLRSGLFRVVLTNITNKTVQIEALSGVDIPTSSYSNIADSIITSTNLTDGGSVDSGLGWSLTAASSVDVSSMAVGDCFTLRTYAIGEEAFIANIGQDNLVIPKVKLLCLSSTLSDGRWCEVLWHRGFFTGINYPFNRELGVNEVTGLLLRDPKERKVGEFIGFQRDAA